MMHGNLKAGLGALALLLACGDGEKRDKDDDGPRSDARTLVEHHLRMWRLAGSPK